jgi:hypothetical protein
MKEGFYKVHKDNIKYMREIGLPQFFVSTNCDVYSDAVIGTYLYISYSHWTGWGYNHYNKKSFEWYKSRGIKYLGEFESRKQKLIRLNEVGEKS